MRPLRAAAAAAVAALLLARGAQADSLVPAQGQTGYDSALEQKADDYDRVIHAIMTPSLGWGLQADIGDAANRQLVDDFVASGARDFQTWSGKHPYQIVDDYGESGDLGMFGGVQAAGDAFRYAVLRDSGAPAALVDEARQQLMAAMRGLHWYMQVTGEPGVIARGLQRITPEAGEPPLPGTVPPTVPLTDASGNPQPAKKQPTWRADRSGKLPFLIWLDDTSKDQFDGYVFALGAVYDVTAKDPDIPATLLDPLVADARALAQRLMQQVQIGTKQIDLVLVDADGRPTTFHDINPREITPGLVVDTPTNGFNALMALGAMRTFYQMTGDEQIGRYYYDELLGTRDYFASVEDTLPLVYMKASTNFSSVNMAFVSAYNLLRYESDPTVLGRAQLILEQKLYAPGKDRQAKGLKQSFFDLIYAAFRKGGSTGAGAQAVSDALDTLRGFPGEPFWNDAVENCDATEIAAGTCTGIDGSTQITLDTSPGHGSSVVATAPLPIELRPPSNFAWRSDPYDVNGGGGPLLNPGGGFHCAYWMGRFLQSTSDGAANVSPDARSAPPPAEAGAGDAGGQDAGVDAGGAAAPAADSGGCGCRLGDAPPASSGALAALALLGLCGLRRRRASASARRTR